MATKPTHEQAQLHLQVFEQRREPRLRQARDWFFQHYFANTMEEAMKIGPMGTEEGTNVMMVFRVLGANLRVAQLRPAARRPLF